MTFKTRARSVALVLLLALAAGGAGYLGGRLHGWADQRETQAQLDVAREEHEKALSVEQQEHAAQLGSLRAELERGTEERTRLQARDALYEGYWHVQQSLGALDARNFGIAQSYLRDAERVLSALTQDTPGLAPLLHELSETNLTIAGNLSEQRQHIASLAMRLDALLGSAASSGRTAAVDAGTF